MSPSPLSPSAARDLLQGLVFRRDRHQEGYVEETGRRIRKWKGHYYTYDDAGKRTHHSEILGLKSKLRKWEAEDALRKIIARDTGQREKRPAQCTLAWFWEHQYLPSRTWGPATRSTNVSLVTRHVLPDLGTVPLAELDKLTIQTHINTLAAGYSRSLVKKALVQVRAILEEAVDQELLDKNPARKAAMPPTRRPCGRFLSLEEFDALTAQLPFRDRLIVRMFCSMGFRPGELFALRCDDVEDARVRIDESVSRFGIKEPKTAGSDAYVRMPAPVAADLALWRAARRVSPAEFVFPTASGKAISAHNYERDVIVPAAIRAGIMAKPPKTRQKGDAKREKATAVNFQAFRRTFGTWMQRTGATVKDVQGALRHASPDQTVRAYMREIPAGVSTAVDELDRLLSEKRGLARVAVKGPVQ